MTFWIIAGPTASGKSDYACQMARHLNGEIINADSQQFYQDLYLLTARPTLHQEQQAAHHGYGILSANDQMSAGKWLSWAQIQIQDIESRGKVAIVVGGTGLYLKALQQGLAKIPECSPHLRKCLQQQLCDQGVNRLYDELQKLDPLYAQKIHPHDRQRIVRGLEVIQATGLSLRYFHAQAALSVSQNFKTILMMPDVDDLRLCAQRRVHQMMEQGIVDEIKALIEKQIPPNAPVFRALGAQAIYEYLQADHACQQTLAQKITQQTWQYIKRQRTWFRHQLKVDQILITLRPDFEVEHLRL